MALQSPELSLDLSPPVVSPSVTDFLARIPVTGDSFSGGLPELNDFISGLEDELRKIQAFKRELPLSFVLLDDAIGKLKEEARKRRERREECKLDESVGAKLGNDYCEKKSWMSSAQLWNSTNEEDDDSHRSEEYKPSKYKGEGGAFPSLREDNSGFLPATTTATTTRDEDAVPAVLSLVTPGLNKPGSRRSRTDGILSGPVFSVTVDQIVKPVTKQPSYHQTARKQRRCWSPELHRRFVDALEKLGGSQVATPKQIRELMQVDGLTNDEVKSHLQKYRLHVRKLPSSTISNPSSIEMATIGQDQHELSCSKMEIPHSGSPEGPLHLSGSAGKCNSTSMEEDEDEKSDGHSWKVQHRI